MKDYSMYNDRIVELNNLHVGLQAIADDVGMYRKTLSKWCKQEGIDINPKSYTRTCEHCNTIYKTTSKASRFCSDKCRVDNNHVRYYNTDVEVECNCCGRSMVVNRIQANRHRVLRCDDCIELDKLNRLIGMSSNIYYQQCNHCGKQWITKRNHLYKHCSNECRYKDEYKPIQHEERTCLECGSVFVPKHIDSKRCSDVCIKKYNNRYKDKRYNELKKIRAYDSSISINEIIRRQGDKCYLCDEVVEVDSHYNSDYYPSIEHVIPISKGGTHEWHNVKLAHRKCNSEKGIKILD